jgi:hypothetical protein
VALRSGALDFAVVPVFACAIGWSPVAGPGVPVGVSNRVRRAVRLFT